MKTENRTIKLTIQNATENLPVGLAGYGADCRGTKEKGEGYYAYVAAPQRKQAVFIHELAAANGGKEFHTWVGDGKDAPPAVSALDGTAAVDAKAAQRAINSMQSAVKRAEGIGGGVLAQTVLRGSWKGYIECHPAGPRITLYRDIAQYSVLALHSVPGEGWEYAVVVKDLKSTHWFTGANRKNLRSTEGVQSLTKSGKNYPSMVRAFNAAMEELFGIISQACSVRDTHRAAAMSPKIAAAARAKQRAKTGRATAPLSKTEAATYRAASAKLQAADVLGALGKRIARKASGIEKKEQRAAEKERKKAERAKVGATKKGEGRVRKVAAKGQSGLLGKFVLFNDTAGESLKDKAGLVTAVGPNARDTYEPKHGGAKVTVLVVGARSVGSREYNEYRNVEGQEKPQRIFGLGGKGTFTKAFYALGKDEAGKVTASGGERLIAEANEHPEIAKAGVKVSTGITKAVQRAAVKAEKEAKKKLKAADKKAKTSTKVTKAQEKLDAMRAKLKAAQEKLKAAKTGGRKALPKVGVAPVAEAASLADIIRASGGTMEVEAPVSLPTVSADESAILDEWLND